MMYAKLQNEIKKKGFTILESLVSISILAVAVTGPLVYVTNSLKAAEIARDQTIAFYLAQDAIEHIKNIRDNNTAFGGDRADWLTGLEACMNTECYFGRSPAYVTPVACPTNPNPNCPFLNMNGTGESFQGYGYENGGAWEQSRFVRTVIIEIVDHDMAGYSNPGNNEEAKITVTVDWTTRNFDRTVNVVEHIFNLHVEPTYEQ